jgi:hypothetical protein
MRQVRACRTDFLNVIKRNYRGGSTLLHNNTGRSNEDIMLIRSRPVFKIQKKISQLPSFFNDSDCSSIHKKLNYIRPGSIFLICKKTVFNLERILIYGKLFHSKGGRSLDRIVRIR